jgi:hypothetical protein
LDCVAGGDQVFVPIDMSVNPDSVAEALVAKPVNFSMGAHLLQEAFCAFVNAGYVSGEFAEATVTINIGGVLLPVPPVAEGTAPAPVVMDFVAACAGDFGPEVGLTFATPGELVQPDGSGPMDFWLTEDSLDIGFVNLVRSDMSVVPQLSLLEICTPTDRSEPLNGTVDDPEDSPRIAADKDGDGTIYEAFASIADQVQVAVSGSDPCLGCEPVACVAGSCQPSQTKTIPVACTNGVTAGQDALPFELTVATTPIDGGTSPQPFTAQFGGAGTFPRWPLDAVQAVVPGGARSAIIEGLTATVSVRSGATGPDVELGPDEAAIVPGPTQFCILPQDTVCDPANDVDPNDPTLGNTDCLGGAPGIVCLDPVLVIDLPISEDCGPGGFCEGIGHGFADGPAAQCNNTDPPEYCITGDLRIPLGLDAGIYTPDSSGAVLFGWVDQAVPGLVTCPAAAPDCQESFMPDGCYDLPAAIYGDPIGNPASIGPIGTRLNVGGAFFLALECAGATAGGICASGEGCIVGADCATAPCTSTPDVVCPTQDAGLISFPIN